MSPFAAAGALAAAYDLGLFHKMAPDTFKGEPAKGMDLRTALIAGLLGYGIGTDGKGKAEDDHDARRRELLDELHRSQMRLLAEREAAARRERELHEALRAVAEQRNTQIIVNRALIDSQKGKRNP